MKRTVLIKERYEPKKNVGGDMGGDLVVAYDTSFRVAYFFTIKMICMEITPSECSI